MGFGRYPFQIRSGQPSVCCDLAAPGAISRVLRENALPVEGTRGGYAAGAAGGRRPAAAKRGPRAGTARLGRLPRLPAPLGPQTEPCAAQQPWPGRDPRRAAPQCGPRPQPSELRRTHSISCCSEPLAPSSARVEASCSQGRAEPVPRGRVGVRLCLPGPEPRRSEPSVGPLSQPQGVPGAPSSRFVLTYSEPSCVICRVSTCRLGPGPSRGFSSAGR